MASTLRVRDVGSCVVSGAWEPEDVTSVLSRNARVFVCDGAIERRRVLVVMLLKIFACVAVVSRRKQYAPRTRSKFGARVRGARWERPGARGWAGVTGMVVVAWVVMTGCS